MSIPRNSSIWALLALSLLLTVPARGQGGARAITELLNRAGTAEQKNDYAGAIAAYSQIIKLQPGDEDAFLDRGDNYASQKDYDHAIADFSSAIGLKPDDARAYDYRGIAYLNTGKNDQALADLSKAIALNPDYGDALQYRGMIYDLKRDLPRAIADYSAILRRDPQNPEMLNARCWDRAFVNRDLDAALDDCNAALGQLKDRRAIAGIRDSRGFVYFRKGDMAHAIADYDAALALAPRAAETLYKRGLAKDRQGDAAGGKADIAAALRLDPHAGDDMTEIGLKP